MAQGALVFPVLWLLLTLSQAHPPPRAPALADASAWEDLPLNIKIAFHSLRWLLKFHLSLSPPVYLSNLAYRPSQSPFPAFCFSPYLSLVLSCHLIYVYGTEVFCFSLCF